MSKKFRDFDAFFSEKKQDPITIKLFGVDEELPASLPADVFLTLVRAFKEYGDEQLPTSVTLDLAMSIFSEEKIQEWSDKGLTVDQLSDIIEWAMEQYNPTGDEGEGGSEGKN